VFNKGHLRVGYVQAKPRKTARIIDIILFYHFFQGTVRDKVVSVLDELDAFMVTAGQRVTQHDGKQIVVPGPDVRR
jgi:hypothetical protein